MFARDDIAAAHQRFAEEVLAVARAEGASPPPNAVEELLAVLPRPPRRTSARRCCSTPRRGATLEWEARNGVVRRLAARHGIATPVERRRGAPAGRRVRSDGIIRFMDPWVIWLIAAVIFAVGEIATLGFFLAPFAGGALVAAIVSARRRRRPHLAGRVPARLGRAARRPAPARPLASADAGAAAHRHGGAGRPHRDGDRAHLQRRRDGLREARGRELDRAVLRRGRRHRARQGACT